MILSDLKMNWFENQYARKYLNFRVREIKSARKFCPIKSIPSGLYTLYPGQKSELTLHLIYLLVHSRNDDARNSYFLVTKLLFPLFNFVNQINICVTIDFFIQFLFYRIKKGGKRVGSHHWRIILQSGTGGSPHATKCHAIFRIISI